VCCGLSVCLCMSSVHSQTVLAEVPQILCVMFVCRDAVRVHEV